jgi:Holliday junction resolvase-like predicted endonuclease
MPEALTYEGFMELLRVSEEKSIREWDRIRREAEERDAAHKAALEAALEAERKVREERVAALEVALEADRKAREAALEADLKADRKKREARDKAFNKMISELGDRMGQIVESMVAGGLLAQLQKANYSFLSYNYHKMFRDPELGISGEIDFFLENDDYVMLVEVKTNLTADGVNELLERLVKYRLYADRRGDKRKLAGAVAGGVVHENARTYAFRKGLYVIHYGEDTVSLAEPPADFKPHFW